MTILDEASSPRWGEVARGSDSESHEKPQELSDSNFRTSQVQAGSTENDSGTREKSDTGLTQPVADSFADRSAMLRVAASQFSSKSLEDQQHERRFMARDLAEWEAGR